jgi:hypothetical protein
MIQFQPLSRRIKLDRKIVCGNTVLCSFLPGTSAHSLVLRTNVLHCILAPS